MQSIAYYKYFKDTIKKGSLIKWVGRNQRFDPPGETRKQRW